MSQEEKKFSDRVKQHLKENKKVYLVGAGCLTAGYLLRGRPEVKNIVDSFNIKYKSPTSNLVITELARRGHPGNKILVNETGEVFASLRRCAEALGVHRIDLYRYFNNEIPDVKGFTFEKLGEMK